MARLFAWLPRARWKRWFLYAAVAGVLFVMMVVTLVGTVVVLWQSPKVKGWVMVKMLSHQARQPAQIPPEPRLSPDEKLLLVTNAAGIHRAADLFQSDKVWDARLRFNSNQWAQLGPNIVPPVFQFMQPDGSIILRNPDAMRNGLAGVFGLDFPWSEAELRFGEVLFRKVGARFKGNGTFVNSQRSYKRPFKIELNKQVKGQKLAGRTVLNFHNLISDATCLSDTLAYQFFRDAGVPAPRTSFARVRLTVEGRFENRLLGLYVLVENPDAQWGRELFGGEGVALFKPVTYDLFKDLGEDWKAYQGIYDPKTKIEPRHSRRLVEFAKFVTRATDDEFAERISEFIDLDEFVRFLACEVILSNYDGLLSNGQNFLLYLQPGGRFGFIPWDLDQCWGEFPFVGTIEQRERASIWHPWIGENRFLERMFKARAFSELYRREMERIRATLFQPERLDRQLDALVGVVRPFIAEESAQRLAKFERETGAERHEATTRQEGGGHSRGFVMRHFFEARATSVSEQLEGRSEGVVLTRKNQH